MNDRCLAIIPARGGSKRIPRKNIRNFCGKPIITYSISAALSSRLFDEVMVSTDDAEIAAIAKKHGAAIPFLRSESTANDHAVIADVIEEVLDEYSKRGKEFAFFCCIFATAPFITGVRLQEGFELMQRMNFDSAAPVLKFSFPIQRALQIENGRVSMIVPGNLNKRSQDLPAAYHDAAQFVWMRTSCFRREKKLLTDNSGAFVLPETEAQDIDTEIDWQIAEMKYLILHGKKQ